MTDLSPELKQFAAEHEMEIKEMVLDKLDEFFSCTVVDNYVEKWDAGVQEHGPMTAEVMQKVNWAEQQIMEFKDAFWYETLLMYQASLVSGGPED
jgi:hypothetical protein